MDKIKIKKDTRQFLNQAWIRDGSNAITGEALILACLLHTHGSDRKGDDYKTVQALMDDINYEE